MSKNFHSLYERAKSLSQLGALIEDFSLAFENRCAVKVSAAKGEEVLGSLVNTDEGAARLGEVALGHGYQFTLRGGGVLADFALEPVMRGGDWAFEV